MTIDEAIEHAEEIAAEEIACGNDQCAKDHAQLADWLRELRRARMEIDLLEALRDGLWADAFDDLLVAFRDDFLADAQKYKAENAKLRELVRDMWCCISHIGEYDVFYYDMAKDGCGMSCTVNGEYCCADKIHDRMRKLGVEEDE